MKLKWRGGSKMPKILLSAGKKIPILERRPAVADYSGMPKFYITFDTIIFTPF